MYFKVWYLLSQDEIIKITDVDFCTSTEADRAPGDTLAALSLKPPSAFFKPIEYPTLHIMVNNLGSFWSPLKPTFLNSGRLLDSILKHIKTHFDKHW